MFEFEKHYKEAVKKTEEFLDSCKQVNEFWVNSILTSTKELFKAVKTK